MPSSQFQDLTAPHIARTKSKSSKSTANVNATLNRPLLRSPVQTRASGTHRISFHPPSPSLHLSPHLNGNHPDTYSFKSGSNAQSFDAPLVEHSPIDLNKPDATVNDGLFLALMMKNISTPTLLSTSNKGILSSNSQPSARRTTSSGRGDRKAKSACHNKVEYFDVGFERSVSGSSGSTKFGSNDRKEATVRSLLDFLEKCDAEFIRETARLSESIKDTRDLIKQVREERFSDWSDSGDSEAEASSSDEERTPVMRYTGHEGAFA